jgi:hypothetical protein
VPVLVARSGKSTGTAQTGFWNALKQIFAPSRPEPS